MAGLGRSSGLLVLLVFELAASASLADCPDPPADSVAALEALAPTDGELPPCASRVMRAIYTATRPLAGDGRLPPELFVTRRNHADPKLLIRGPQIFGAKADAIAGARIEVAYQTFVWEPGSEPTETLLRGLKELEARRRAEAAPGAPPVRVFILIDASDSGLYALPFPIGEQRARRELADLHLDPRYVEWEVTSFPHLLTGNLHSKVLTVDGRVAILTGANPEQVHASGNPWYDLGFRFEGEVAAALRAELAEAWLRGVTWACPDWTMEPKSCTRENWALPPLELPADHYADLEDACTPMLVVGRHANENPFSHSGDANTQNQAYLAGIRASEQTVRIQTPNLNDNALKDALVRAAKAGTPVKILTSREFNYYTESVPGVGGSNASNVHDLYRRARAAGIADPCSVLQVKWFSPDGGQPMRGNGGGASHAKYASFDSEVAIVGSTNGDQQSWHRSREVDVVADDAAAVHAWDAQYDRRFEDGILAEECGGPTPVFQIPSLLDLVLWTSLRPRRRGPPLSLIDLELQKHLGRWHVGLRFERMAWTLPLGMWDPERRNDRFTIDDKIFGIGTAYDINRSGRTSLFAHFEYEDDALNALVRRSRGTAGFRHQLEPWSAARLTLDVGAGAEQVDPRLAPGRAGGLLFASSRLGWQPVAPLVLHGGLTASVGGPMTGLLATGGLQTVLTDRIDLRLDGLLRYEQGLPPVTGLDWIEGNPALRGASWPALPGARLAARARLFFELKL